MVMVYSRLAHAQHLFWITQNLCPKNESPARHAAMEKSRYQNNVNLGHKPGGIMVNPCGLLVLSFVHSFLLLFVFLGKVVLTYIITKPISNTATHRIILHTVLLMHYKFNFGFHGTYFFCSEGNDKL